MSFDTDTERKRRERIEDTLADILDNQLYSVPLNDVPATFGSLGTRSSADGDDGGNRSSLPTLHEISEIDLLGVATGVFDNIVPAAETIILDAQAAGNITVKNIHEFIDGMIIRVTPAISRIVDFVTGGNISLPNGPFRITDNEMCELQYFADTDTWKCIGIGNSSGGGSVNYPLRYPLSQHGTIGLVTEIFSWNFHGHRATLSGDITVGFADLPSSSVGQDIKLHFFHDGLPGERIITFLPSVINLTTVTLAAGQEAVVVLTTDDGGITFHAYSESGINNVGSGGNVPDGTQVRQHLEWDGVAWIAQQNISFDNDTPALQFRDTIDSSFISIKSTIGNNLQIARGDDGGTGLELFSFHPTTPELFTMRQLNNGFGEMILNTTGLKIISEVAANGSYEWKDGVNDMMILAKNITESELKEIHFLNLKNSNRDPLLFENGQFSNNSGHVKVATGNKIVNLSDVGTGVDKIVDQTDFTPDLAPIRGDLIVRLETGSFVELLRGANGKILTANSATATGLEWADAPGSQTPILQDVDYAGFKIDNISELVSNATNPAATGNSNVVRLGSQERIAWRKSDNLSDVYLKTKATDAIEINTDFLPDTTVTRSLGANSFRWSTLWTQASDISNTLQVGGDATFAGNVFLGNGSSDDLNISARLNSNLIPKTDNAFDLGSSLLQFRNVYVDGIAEIDRLENDGVAIGVGDDLDFDFDATCDFNQTQSSAGSGIASALPSTPEAYIRIKVNGVAGVVPWYPLS